jgi:hypothetical protein
MINRYIKLLFFIVLSINVSAQDSVAYSRDYEFKEGVFLTLQHFLNNEPVLKSDIITSVPMNQVDFLKEVMQQKTIKYKDAAGVEKTLEVSTVWGYCQNRALYLNFNKEFNRLNTIGSLCHFAATVTTPTSSYRDPMGYNYGINTTYQELRQFVYDSSTNKVYDFNTKTMEFLLKKDDALYKEFMKLKKRKKADSLFIYLRKYNEKHPLYLAKK